MKKRLCKTIICLFIFATAVPCTVIGQQNNDTAGGSSIIAKGATLQLISNKFKFTEGPAADKHGNIFFTDQPNDKIWKYDTEGKLSVFMEKSGRSNGLYFDKKGNLIACADERNELWSIDSKGKSKVLLSDYKGFLFNGPNDLWIDPKGGVYFTDPLYQRDYWTRKGVRTNKQEVYYLAPNRKEAVVIASNTKQPNGIIGTPDGKVLYVADIGDNKIYKYAINEDGSLQSAEVFAKQGSDGMTIDNTGNIYLAGNGITVFNSKGKLIEHINVPAKWTGNVCFGGKKMDKLFITASEAIYVLNMQVKGVQ